MKKRILLNTLALLITILTVLMLSGCDGTEYTLTVEQDEHATVTTDKASYLKGQTVHVTQTVDDGYICTLQVGYEYYYGDFPMPGYDAVIKVITRPRQYRINYENTDGCSYSGILPTDYTVEESAKLPWVYKAGYEFDGWYTDSGFKNKITSIAEGSTGDITVYPKLIPTVYTPIYHLPEGVENNPSNPTSYTVESEALPLYDIEQEGCDFLGWYTSDSFKGEPLGAIPSGYAENIDLYPKFLSTDYTDDGYRIIRNKLDLEHAFSYSEYDKEGKYRLMGDIAFGDGEQNPIVSGFSGIFDGGGHSIKNLSRALFDTLNGGTVENLSFSTVQSHTLKVSTDITRKIGGLVNSTHYENGTSYIRNVRVISAKIDTHLLAPLNLGAIVGYAHGSGSLVIEKCLVENLDFNIFAAGSTSVGGVLGHGKATVSECAVRMDEDDRYYIECTKSNSEFYVGGLVGYAFKSSVNNSYFRQESVSVKGFYVYASKYCVDVAVGGLIGCASSSSVTSSYAMLSEINFETNAVSLTPIQIHLAGLIGCGNASGIADSYTDSYSSELKLNSNVTEYGITMRVYMGYLASSYHYEGAQGVSYSRSRSMPSSIKANGTTVSNAYIDDRNTAFSSFGASYDEIWDEEVWVHRHGYRPELKFLVKEE